MKPSYAAAALTVLLLAGAAVFWPDAGIPEVKEESAVVRAPAASSASSKTATPRESQPSAADPVRQEEASAAIHDAVLTYDPAGVAVIRPFLLEAEPLDQPFPLGFGAGSDSFRGATVIT